ncbi:MAG: hypothetical protein WCH98_01370 [Verrucomicrobiota bacterium]
MSTPSALTKVAILVLLSIVVSALSSRAEETKNVRVVFWNMEWFPGGSPTATSREVVAQITKAVPVVAKLAPDIFCAEEILDEKAMVISLYKTPGVTPQVCSAFLDDTGAVTMQQIAIASRSPSIGCWWESWKPGAVTPKRGFSLAVFEPVPGNVLLVYAVHLKSNRGQLAEDIAMREESARQLLAHIGEMEKAYGKMGKVGVIIGGDFNTSRDDAKFHDEETLELFRKAGFKWVWDGVPHKDRVTMPASPSHDPKFPPFPAACFDHAFTKGVKVSSASVAAIEDNPCDHRPVQVNLEFPLPPAAP